MGSLSCAVPVLRKGRERIPSIPYSTGFLFVCLFVFDCFEAVSSTSGWLPTSYVEVDDLELRNLLPPRTALQACKNTHLWGADNQTQGLGHVRQGFSHPNYVPNLKSTVLNFHVHLSPQEDLLALRLPILTNL